MKRFFLFVFFMSCGTLWAMNNEVLNNQPDELCQEDFYECSKKTTECAKCFYARTDYEKESEQFYQDVVAQCQRRLEDGRVKFGDAFKPCVILDVDDTALDTWNEYDIALIKDTHEIFSLYNANPWILQLCQNYLQKKNIDIFYVTARGQDLYQITLENLQAQGYSPKLENLICVPNNVRITAPLDQEERVAFFAAWKLEQWKLITQKGYRVIATIDDQRSNLKASELEGVACWFRPLNSYWSCIYGCHCVLNKMKWQFEGEVEEKMRRLNQQEEKEEEANAPSPK